MAQRGIILDSLSKIGPEVIDEELLNFPLAHMDVMVTSKNIVGKISGDLTCKHANGLMLNKVIKEYQEILFTQHKILDKIVTLSLSGKMNQIEEAAKEIGYLDKKSPETDIIFVGLGIVLGGLFGLLSVIVF
jgi:putative transport protein